MLIMALELGVRRDKHQDSVSLIACEFEFRLLRVQGRQDRRSQGSISREPVPDRLFLKGGLAPKLFRGSRDCSFTVEESTFLECPLELGRWDEHPMAAVTYDFCS